MNVDRDFYTKRLYPLLDRVLNVINEAQTPFYLTGGTALSRGYLHHRYSDDLDLFVNAASPRGDDPRYKQWRERVLSALRGQTQRRLEIPRLFDDFAALMVHDGAVTLKIELINDVPSHIGEVRGEPELGRLDSLENILANKLTVLVGRNEPRDVADIWAIVKSRGLSVETAILDASTKAGGLYHAVVAERLCAATQKDWELVMWTDPPELETYLADLAEIGEQLILPK